MYVNLCVKSMVVVFNRIFGDFEPSGAHNPKIKRIFKELASGPFVSRLSCVVPNTLLKLNLVGVIHLVPSRQRLEKSRNLLVLL